MTAPIIGEWSIDPWHSSVAFTVQVNTMSSLDGRFDQFAGTIVFAEDGGHRAEGAVAAASVDTNLAQRDDNLRKPETLDAMSYPDISFTSNELVRDGHDGLLVTGALTIRGVTHEIELRGRLEGPIVDALQTERIGLDLRGAIGYAAFGVGGLPVVADRVELRLGLQAVRA